MRLALGHSGDACKDFQRALSLDAGRASACTGIAHCLKMEKKYSEAEGEYTKALGIDSTSVGPDVGLDCSSAGALAGRGSVREELGKTKEALGDYKARGCAIPAQFWHNSAQLCAIRLTPPSL